MKQRFFRSLADLRFAIAILLIIASFSIIGTVIEQDQSIEIYKLNYPLTNRVFGFLSWDIILRFGLDHVYKTWWFISFIVIFGIGSIIGMSLIGGIIGIPFALGAKFSKSQKIFRLSIGVFSILIGINVIYQTNIFITYF